MESYKNNSDNEDGFCPNAVFAFLWNKKKISYHQTIHRNVSLNLTKLYASIIQETKKAFDANFIAFRTRFIDHRRETYDMDKDNTPFWRFHAYTACLKIRWARKKHKIEITGLLWAKHVCWKCIFEINCWRIF